MTKIMLIILSVFFLALIILVHEWGHFIAARIVGVRVNEFALGMGPKLWSKKKKDTLYSIRILPIGGFCSMEGETGEQEGPAAPDSMLSKKPWERFFIFAAGAFMNFVLALIFMIIFMSYKGYSTNIIDHVEKGMPAYSVLQVGDKIIAINNAPIKALEDVSRVLEQNKSESEYVFKIERKEQGVLTVKVASKWMTQEGRARFGFSTTIEHFHIGKNILGGIKQTGTIIKQNFTGFIDLITLKVKADQLAGIVGIAQISSQAWQVGMERSIWNAVMNLVYIAVVISASLGVFNLLPIPALDGGRIFFILIEIIRGKAIDPEKEGMVHFVGFVLLMALMVFVLYNDTMRIIK